METSNKSRETTPIEQFSRWEQREIYSFREIDLQQTNIELVDKIVGSIINFKNLSWSSENLNLLSESLIQKKLREQGYEILCWNLNDFPTSSEQLKIKLKKISKVKVKKAKTKKISIYLNKITSLLTSRLSISLLVIIYLACNNFNHFWWGFIASFLFCNTVSITSHYYWWHPILKPKNKYIGVLLDFYTMFFHVTAYVDPVNSPKKSFFDHSHHHKFFGKDKDPTSVERQRYNGLMFFFNRSLTSYFGKTTYTKVENLKYSSLYNKFNPMEKFLEDYCMILLLVTHLILVVLLGFYYYVLFVWVPVIYYWVGSEGTEALCFYKDNCWSFPFFLDNAYHRSHHQIPSKIIMGPRKLKLLKYVNPQYWYIKLFYYHRQNDLIWVENFPLPIYNFLSKPSINKSV
jgi:hypothetical protein